MIQLVLVFAVLVAFDLAAIRFGADTRSF